MRPAKGSRRSWLLLLLALAAVAHASRTPVGLDSKRTLQAAQSSGLAADPPLPPPLPPPPLLHSTSCHLAGSWCPGHELLGDGWLKYQHGLQHSWATGSNRTRSNHDGGQAGASSSEQQPGPSGWQQSGGGEGPLQHKPLWPLSGWDVVGMSAATLALLLAASGGIGGGAILVPLYLVVLGFSTSGAVALSNITIVGGTLANLAFNIGRQHPLRQGPLIDWDLILVMEPSTILGALVGGYLNQLLPGWLTTVSLAILLTFITWKMAAKAAQIRRAEQAALRRSLRGLAGRRRRSAAGQGALREPLLGGEGAEAAEAGLQRASQHLLYVAASGDVLRSGTPSPLAPGHRPGSESSLSGSEAVEADAPASTTTSTFFTAVEGSAAAGSYATLDGLEAELGSTGAGEDSPRSVAHPGSEPVPTSGTPDSGVLPLLTPVDASHDPRLQLQSDDSAVYLSFPDRGTKPAPAAPAQQSRAVQALPPSPFTGTASRAQPADVAPRWRPHVPWGKLAVLLALLAGVVASDVLKMRAVCPSLAYWLRATAVAPITLAVLLSVRSYLLGKAKSQRVEGHEPVEGDVEWTPASTLLYPGLCTFAGVCAGAFGVGGGIVKGPLMLEMGVLPEVAAATSATMITFTAAAASVVFVSFGAVQVDYAVALFLLGLLSTMAGQLLVMWVSRHIRSRSLLVVIMAAVLGISAVALAAQGTAATLAAARDGALWRFHDICGRSA